MKEQLTKFNECLTALANHTGIAPERILAKNQKNELVTARQVITHYLYANGCSKTQLGLLFNQTYVGAGHSIERCGQMLDVKDKITVNYYNALKQHFQE